MIKKCAWCGNFFQARNPKTKYCSAKCKKDYENSRRGGATIKSGVSSCQAIPPPDWLNDEARGYWDRMAPTVIARGHLNLISSEAFAELCDLYSRLRDINENINKVNRNLVQKDDDRYKESVLSDLKRKYSRQFMDYCKQFYLTPMSNRGNFGLEDLGGQVKEAPDSIFD